MSTLDIAEHAERFLWPLVVLFFITVGMRRLGADLRPIFLQVVNGLARSAGVNAGAWAIVIGFGLSASLSAFYDVFWTMDRDKLMALSYHQYAALWCKILNPFVVTVVAKVTANPFLKSKPDTQTTPPFPVSTPPPAAG